MCELCRLFRSNKPFRFHRPDEITKGVLVGRKARKYFDFLCEDVYPLAMENPIMTTVIGPPGSGKTQLLNYFESTQNKKNRFCVVLNLNDIQVDYSYLVDSLAKSDSFREFLNFYGYSLQCESSSIEKVVEIKELIKKIRAENGNENIGICFLVDAVDEYIRNIKNKMGTERGEIIRDLMRNTSKLLDDLQHACTIFAITNEVSQEFKKILENDIFLKSKFLFIIEEDNSTKEKKDLTLEKFDKDENEEMIETFLNLWAIRNGITLPEYEETIASSGRNLFPYTRNAVNIFWKAGAIPGDTCLACLIALDRKLNLAEVNSNDPSHLIVTEVDAAWIVNQFSSYFYYEQIDLKKEEQTDFENIIFSLLSGSRLDSEMKKIVSKAKSSYFDCSDKLPEAFRSYLEALREGFSIKSGNTHKFIKCKYGLDIDFDTIDLIVDFKMKKIGLQLIVKEDDRELNNRKIYEKMDTLISALKNKQIEKGLIVLISDTENEETRISALLKRRDEKVDLSFSFETKDGEQFKINHFSATSISRISKDDAWCLLGLHTFIKSSNNSANDLMEKYSKHIEKKIGVLPIFEQLLKKEVEIIHQSRKKLTCADLYK